jgi:hypothetical protein
VGSVVCFQLVYPAVIQSAFGLFSCKTLADGSSTFRSLAPHLDCASDEARVARAAATASLAVWGVGFPIILGVLLNRKASDPKYSFVIVSCGYKSALRHWEAWECMKKFGILLIITFLQFSPELAATVLLLFLCFTVIVAAASEPFISSLVNKAHLACDFLVIFVVLLGLLSIAAGQRWPGEIGMMSIAVVSYSACVLAALGAILVIEAGSILRPDGALHAVWDSFVESNHAVSNHAAAVAAAVKRLSSTAVRRLSGFGSFTSIMPVVPLDTVDMVIQVPNAAADGSSASPDLRSLSNDLRQPAGSDRVEGTVQGNTAKDADLTAQRRISVE